MKATGDIVTKITLSRVVVSAILVTAAPAQQPRPLDFRTIALNGDKGGMPAVVDGQPRLVDSRTAWNEWTLRETDKGWTIQGQSSGEKPEARSPSVDKEGKVTLVAEPGNEAYWKLSRKGDSVHIAVELPLILLPAAGLGTFLESKGIRWETTGLGASTR
jgi:hypothetical protein